MMSRMPSLLDEETAGPTGAQPKKESSGGRSGFLASPTGRVVLGAFFVLAIGFGVFRILGAVGGDAAEWPEVRIMDPETGDLCWITAKPGEYMPFLNPKTGERSMYPAEYCFNNECGPAGGTPVVLNIVRGIEGETRCPRCGDPVKSHNPRPDEYMTAIPADW